MQNISKIDGRKPRVVNTMLKSGRFLQASRSSRADGLRFESYFVALPHFRETFVLSNLGYYANLEQQYGLWKAVLRQQEIALASSTIYEHNGSVSSRDSVKVGDIVVIRAGQQVGLLIANSVHSRSELRLDLRNPKYPAHLKKDDGKQGANSGDSPK
jgi:hypothetical protein